MKVKILLNRLLAEFNEIWFLNGNKQATKYFFSFLTKTRTDNKL